MFIMALFTIAKLRNQPTCPSAGELITNVVLYAQWSILQSQRMKSCHFQKSEDL
jgi:hypothetical protein